MPSRSAQRASWGSVRKRASGHWQVRYTGSDGKRYSATTEAGRPLTFDTKSDAQGFLAVQRAAIIKGTWEPPDLIREPEQPETLGSYAEAWLATRELSVRTREQYRYLLDRHVLPEFAEVAIKAITPAKVRAWHARDARPTARAQSYGLLRSILGTAVGDGIIDTNPCQVRGGGQAKTRKRIEPLSLDELAALTAALPPRYRMLAQLACWCSLRFGELAGLQRGDIDLKHGVIHIRRGVVRTKEGLLVKGPKTTAGLRAVTIPPHISEALATHLRDQAASGKTGWVFPGRNGGPLAASTLQRVFEPAAAAAERPDVTPHTLRHTGQTYAARNGANLRELMDRAGQVSPAAALRYLHGADERQRDIADRLAAFATATAATVTPLRGSGRSRKAQ